MDVKKLRAALIAAGIAAAAATLLIALILILKGEPMGGTIPVDQKCSSDGECSVLECAECMKCHVYQNRCVYTLRNEKACICVEKETSTCEVDGSPGKKTCVKLDKNSTDWSKCAKL